jgi:type IV secretion system protein TrbL
MIFANVLNQFYNATTPWAAVLIPLATKLFFLLATIQIIWIGLRLLFSEDDATGITGRGIFHIFTLGFFYALLLNAQAWIGALIGGFVRAGELAAGTGELNPSAVIDQGLSIAGNIYATLGWWGTFKDPGITTVASIAVIAIFICYGLIAGLMLTALIDMYITIGGGPIFLGFGGSQWTRPIVERFLSHALSVGVYLFVLMLLISVGQNLAQQWAINLRDRSAESLRVYGEVIIGIITFTMAVWRSPNKAADMMTGVFSFTTHEAARMGAGAISAGIAAAPFVGGAMQMAGGTAANAISHLTNAVQAGGAKIAGFFNGGGQGGSTPPSGSPGGGSPSPQSAAALSAFRNAGQNPQASPNQTNPHTPPPKNPPKP